MDHFLLHHHCHFQLFSSFRSLIYLIYFDGSINSNDIPKNAVLKHHIQVFAHILYVTYYLGSVASWHVQSHSLRKLLAKKKQQTQTWYKFVSATASPFWIDELVWLSSSHFSSTDSVKACPPHSLAPGHTQWQRLNDQGRSEAVEKCQLMCSMLSGKWKRNIFKLSFGFEDIQEYTPDHNLSYEYVGRWHFHAMHFLN